MSSTQCHVLRTRLLLLRLQGTEVWVHLSHPWCDCPIAVGDAANIIGGAAATDEAGRSLLYLSGSQGLLVLHPDVLLSGEAVDAKEFVNCVDDRL
jgi:hypothetical protein